MIPKKIHYIWLGDRKPNNLVNCCINSWRRILKEYQIYMWNEENLPLESLRKSNRFLDRCIELKLWAFVSDYLRLYVLFNEGGIYLDTDVEVLKNFDEFLDSKMFLGYEHLDYIGTGIIGAERHSPAIKRLLDFYDEEIWHVKYYTNPLIFSELIKREPEVFKDCRIYEKEYFSPYNPVEPSTDTIGSERTITIHWYNANWGMSRKGYVFLSTKHESRPLIRQCLWVRKNIGYLRHKRKWSV